MLNGRYALESKVGAGAVGMSYRARDIIRGDAVTIKALRSGAPAHGLEREFLTLRGLSHPNIVEVRDLIHVSLGGPKVACLVSSFADGTSLAEHAPRGGALLPPVLGLLSALAFLHSRGVVHGDVKASNVIVGPSGSSTLIDFGCSRACGQYADVYGTPDHMSPEAARGHACPEADMYALGVTLERLLEASPGTDRRALASLALALSSPDPHARPTAVAALDRLGARGALAPTAAGRASRFVGRATELAVVESVARALLSGAPGPRVVAVEGAPSVGRTRFLVEARLRVAPLLDTLECDPRSRSPVPDALARVGGAPAVSGVAAAVRLAAHVAGGASPSMLFLDDGDAQAPWAVATLHAVLRSLRGDGKLAMILVSNSVPELPSVVRVPLSPWTAEQVASWLGDAAPGAGLARVYEITRGYPKSVVQLVGDRPSALLTPASMDRRRQELARSADDELYEDGEERRVVLAVDVAEGSLPERWFAPLGLDRSAVERLVSSGLLSREDGRLRRAGSARTVTGADALKMHLALAAIAEAEGKTAEAIVYLARAGSLARARELLSHALLGAAEPHTLLAAADALALAAPSDPMLALDTAKVFLEAGDPVRALSALSRAMRSRPPRAVRARLRTAAAACSLRRGDTRRAVQRLRRALAGADPDQRPRIGPELALALIRSGNPSAALDVLDALAGPETSADRLCSRAVAMGYLGRDEEAAAILSRGVPVDASFRVGVRWLSARGVVAGRRGRVAEAAVAHDEALALAERASLDDLIVALALNCGTARHLLGDLGAALAAYERGDEMARALGSPAAGVSLDFNRGKLLADAGAWAQARSVLDRALAGARRENMRHLAAACRATLAEVEAAEGKGEAANAHLDAAVTIFRDLAAKRELAEVLVQRGDVQLSAHAASDAIASADSALGTGCPDVEGRALRLKARALLLRGDPAAAAATIEAAERTVSTTEQALLVAEVASTMSDVLAARGASVLAQRAANRAAEIWERVGMGLPAPLDRVFREDPRRARTMASAAPPPQSRPPPVERTDDRLRHLVAINRRMGSADTAAEILEAALDAAIELTGAERGFLLVRDGAGLRVAVARNFDRERVARSQTKFSHDIARRVLASGQAVVAIDAGQDPRFEKSRSVHALELKSILCVPMSGRKGVVGALYVDFRYRAGAFASDDVDVVRGFADQAVIALGRAELLDELKAKNAELESERERLARLAEGRALEIERLHGKLDPRKVESSRGRSYPEIVGRGASMGRVFDLMDRVVDTDLTVLIQGESGTGKELVARAIHDHGPRRDRPFVPINCGALPPALFEGELFGYRKGAFTGAVRDHAGLFVAAHTGTIFLDELGELALDLQVKLLRALQQREVLPLGAESPVPVDIRVLCATHRDMRARIKSGHFREDLYYRIAVVTLELPPLRERPEDVPALAAGILERAARSLRRPAPALDRSADRALLRHPFPGNVRELENVLTKALLVCDSQVIRDADLDLADSVPTMGRSSPRPRGATPQEAVRFRTTLEATGWNVCEAARVLSIPRATFYRKLRRYGLERPD